MSMRTNRSLFTLLFAFGCVLGAASSALANDTMDVLTSGKRLELTDASGAVFTVTFTSNGRYIASTGSSGTWTIDGERLCTLRTGASAEYCDTLPSGKGTGDSWRGADSNGNPVTVRII